MIKAAQKCRYWVASLLLLAFINVLTFLPGSNAAFEEAVLPHSSAVLPVSSDETEPRSTILELVLENIAGLRDCLPDSEKQDFIFHDFSAKLRNISWFLSNLSPPPAAIIIKPLAVSKQIFGIDEPEHLPLLQHHSFIFRLTPF